MAFEKMIKNAFNQSRDNCRYGDTLEEIAEIQDYIKNAKRICIPNKTGIKVKVLNEVFKKTYAFMDISLNNIKKNIMKNEELKKEKEKNKNNNINELRFSR